MAETLSSIVLSRHLHSASGSLRASPTPNQKELARLITVTPLHSQKPIAHRDWKPRLLSLSPILRPEPSKVILKSKSRTPSVALPSVSPQLFQRESASSISLQRVKLRRRLPDQKSAKGGGFTYSSRLVSPPRLPQYRILRDEFHGQVTGKRLMDSMLGWTKARPGEWG